MLEDELTYYRRRAKVELEQAQRAQNPSAVKAHCDLASAYLDRVGWAEALELAQGKPRIGTGLSNVAA